MQAFAVRLRNKATGEYLPAGAPPSTQPYEAASKGPRLFRWPGNSSGPNASVGGNFQTLRARSRDRRRNDGVADTGVEVLTSSVIGTGIKPQFNTADAGLNKALAELWLTWTDESDADGRCDFYGQQALAFASMMEGGDVFARLRARRIEDGLSVPLQVQVLESEYCPVEKNESRGLGWIQNGVEFDAIGRRVNYWLFRDHPGDAQITLRGNTEAYPVPAADVVHLAGVRRPGLIRGEPWLARALVKLYDTDQVDDAMVLKTKISNLFAGFVRPTAEGKFGWDESVDSGGVLTATLEPGMMQVLEPGADIAWSTPPDVGANYDPFMRGQMRRIAASIGVLYEQLTGDFSQVNDRTWRAAMNEFTRRIERIQHQLVVFQFCRPILMRWAEMALLSGAIRLPRGVTVKDVARPKWIPQARPYINPVTDVEAKVAEIRAGLVSRAEKVSEGGRDVEQVDAEIAADNTRADALGLVYDSDPRLVQKSGASQQAAAQPNPQEVNP